MAPSSPMAAVPTTASAAAPPQPLPYNATALRSRRPPPVGRFPLSGPGTPSLAAGTATSLVAPMRGSDPRASRWVTHGSFKGASCRIPREPPSLQPGLPLGSASRGLAVLARYFREGSSLGDPGGDVPLAPSPPEPASAPPASGANGAQGACPAQEPYSNAVPFVHSTRQRHRNHHHDAAAATRRHERPAPAAALGRDNDDRAAGIPAGLGGGEEAEAYAGPDEEIRRRSHALREATFPEAEQRAIAVHPSILVEDLAAEATVPYGAAGSLTTPASRGGEGEAEGTPSRGAGPHRGLAVESVDPETGGFTTSLPAVDPAHDDVGRAIREDHDAARGHRCRQRRQPSSSSSSLLGAEARARKAATAEDLRESLLAAAPELQTTYRVFGLPHTEGAVAASGEVVEELLEVVPFGLEGAVLEESADLPLEDASALANPLGPPAGGGGGGGDPLVALEALEHQEMLDLLESGAVNDIAAPFIEDDYADISNVIPSPLPDIPNTEPRGSGGGGAAAAAADTSSSSSSTSMSGSGSGTHKVVMRRGGGAAAAGAGAARARRRAPARSVGVRPGPHVALSHQPPFYHNSPDVAEEDLVRRHRWSRPRRRLFPTAATAAAAARAVLGVDRVSGGAADAGTRVPQDSEDEGPREPAGEAAAADVLSKSASWVRQAPLYNASPDVQDEELEHPTPVARSVLLPRDTTPGATTAPPVADPVGKLSGSFDSLKARSNGGGGGAAPAASQATPPQAAPAASPSAASVTAPKHASHTAQLSQSPSQPLPRPPPMATGDGGRRLRSLSDVDRQFIDLDTVSGWDEQAQDLRTVMRSTMPKQGRQERQATQPPGARGASSSLQPQTIGIHGRTDGDGAAAAADRGGNNGGGADGHPVMVTRVEYVPSQTYGVARTAAVLAADGKLTLLARPAGPSPERVRAALKLLRMAPDSRAFKTSAVEAAATAATHDEQEAAAVTEAAMAAVGTPALELEGELRPPSLGPTVGTQDLQPGLILGQSEIDPGEVPADPNFPLDSSSWTHCHGPHDPHDPHAAPAMIGAEGHMLGLHANMWQEEYEDYDEVMGQIHDGQRSGWSEDGVNGVFDSDVY